MLHDLIAFWFRILENWGYLGIVVLMAMESSIFPVPSEVVMPPAAYWVSQGRMEFWPVVLAGTFGSWMKLIEPFNPGWSFIDRSMEAFRAFRFAEDEPEALEPE